MEIVAKVTGSARCGCGWRGQVHVIEFEKPDDWAEWDEFDRRVLPSELEHELSGLVLSDKDEHVRSVHLKPSEPSVFCGRCRQSVSLDADGNLPQHDYQGMACSNFGVTPEMQVVNGGSPGGGKRM